MIGAYRVKHTYTYTFIIPLAIITQMKNNITTDVAVVFGSVMTVCQGDGKVCQYYFYRNHITPMT